MPRLCPPVSVRVASILILLAASAPAYAVRPYTDWSTATGGSNIERIQDVAADAYGNWYVLGHFLGQLDLGAGVLTTVGNWDFFLAKYGPDGSILWSQSFGSVSADISSAVSVDPWGFVSITGHTQGSPDFGLGPVPHVAGYDIVFAKFTPGGTPVFSLSYGGPGNDYARAVTSDAEGNVIIGGNYDQPFGIYTHAGATDILVVKFSASGAVLWGHGYGSVDYEYAASVDTDPSGNVILGAYGYDPLDFGGGLLPAYGSLDGFIVKLDAAGTHIWSQSVGGSSGDYVGEVQSDGAGNIVAGLYCAGSPDLGGGPIPSNGGYDAYLARYDPDGNHVWSAGFGGPDADALYAMDLSADGGIALTGYFRGTADYGTGPLTAIDEDVMLARYAPDGTPLWSRRFGGPAGEVAYGVAFDPDGNIALGGYFDVAIDLGDGVFVGQGNDDIFLGRFLEGPVIQSVADIPGDQGGRVNITWDACTVDNTTDQQVTSYSVWRSLDAPAATALVEDGATLVKDPSGLAAVAADARALRVETSPSGAPAYWFKVGAVNALGIEGYSFPAVTAFDSTSGSPANQYFQVIAHTIDPFEYYTSDPDSGHSVDNLAPAAVQGLVATQQPVGLELLWRSNTEADLSHYEIYRGTDPGFPADPGNFLAATPDTTSLDGGWMWDGGFYYKVFAVDTHGNRSPHALVGPGLVVGAGSAPAAAALEQNVPNPFNPTTTIGFTLIAGARVTLRIYDAAGRLVRTLADGDRGAGHHTASWNGRDDAGGPVASGVYFYRLSAGAFTDTKKMVLLK